MGSVKHIKTAQEYTQILSTAGDKTVVVDFTASWCPPCKAIAPLYEKLSTKYPNAVYLKVDVDEVQAVAASAGVTAMPTFHFYQRQRKVDEVVGANVAQLEALIKKHTAGTVAGSSASAVGEGLVPGYVDLTSFVDIKQTECLNQKQNHEVRSIFNANKESFLESDCDEQLLITINFMQPVKIHSLKVLAPPEKAPKNIKLFVNRGHMGFDETESVECTQALELSQEDYKETAVSALRFVKFQAVTRLILFVEDNLGGADETVIQQLVLYGQPVETTKDVSQMKTTDGNDLPMAAK